MSYASYFCKKCEKVDEFKKKYGEDFPEEIEVSCLSGKSKGSKVCKLQRTFDSVPVVSVAEGRLGNASTGYSNSVAGYNPSPFSPMNKVYKSGRMSMFNDNGTVSGSTPKLDKLKDG